MKLHPGFLQKIKEFAQKSKLLKKIPFKAGKTSGYAYTNTRVRVMKTKLLQKEDYSKILKMSFPEIARFMQDTEYRKEISDLAPFYEDANLIEYSLYRNLENTFNRIIRFSINVPQKQVKLYLKRYDILNLKTFLRGKFRGESDDTILLQMVCAGELDRAFFEKALKNSNGFEEAVKQISGTEYYWLVHKFKADLSRLEDELDKYYYSSVLLEAEPELEAYIREEIKVKNRLIELRAQKTNIKLEYIEGEAGKKIPLASNSDSVENRVFLKKLLVSRANKMASEFKRNIRPLLGYFISKENEISNIRMIVRGKSSELSLDLIEKQLVV